MICRQTDSMFIHPANYFIKSLRAKESRWDDKCPKLIFLGQAIPQSEIYHLIYCRSNNQDDSRPNKIFLTSKSPPIYIVGSSKYVYHLVFMVYSNTKTCFDLTHSKVDIYSNLQIFITRRSGHYAPILIAPVEGWGTLAPSRVSISKL